MIFNKILPLTLQWLLDKKELRHCPALFLARVGLRLDPLLLRLYAERRPAIIPFRPSVVFSLALEPGSRLSSLSPCHPLHSSRSLAHPRPPSPNRTYRPSTFFVSIPLSSISS